MRSTVAAMLAWLAAAGFAFGNLSCGGSARPASGNQIYPIHALGCESPPDSALPDDQRGLVAMVIALSTAQLKIYQVSPSEFRIFTDFKDHKGISVAFEAQIYADGSAMLTTPDTMPNQDARSVAHVQKWGHRVATYFDRFKCESTAQLRTKLAHSGYSI
jgi:hypothetical protein